MAAAAAEEITTSRVRIKLDNQRSQPGLLAGKRRDHAACALAKTTIPVSASVNCNLLCLRVYSSLPGEQDFSILSVMTFVQRLEGV